MSFLKCQERPMFEVHKFDHGTVISLELIRGALSLNPIFVSAESPLLVKLHWLREI